MTLSSFCRPLPHLSRSIQVISVLSCFFTSWCSAISEEWRLSEKPVRSEDLPKCSYSSEACMNAALASGMNVSGSATQKWIGDFTVKGCFSYSGGDKVHTAWYGQKNGKDIEGELDLNDVKNAGDFAVRLEGVCSCAYKREACILAAQAKGYEAGGYGLAFASHFFPTKGCFNIDNVAFYGLVGDERREVSNYSELGEALGHATRLDGICGEDKEAPTEPAVSCVYDKESCMIAAKVLQLEMGTGDLTFANESYKTKGCHAYSDGELKGKMFYGLLADGSELSKSSQLNSVADVNVYRPMDSTCLSAASLLDNAHVPTSAPRKCDYSRAACVQAARKQGFGLDDNGQPFQSDFYPIKGCHSFRSGTFEKMAFYGTVDGQDVTHGQLNGIAQGMGRYHLGPPECYKDLNDGWNPLGEKLRKSDEKDQLKRKHEKEKEQLLEKQDKEKVLLKKKQLIRKHGGHGHKHKHPRHGKGKHPGVHGGHHHKKKKHHHHPSLVELEIGSKGGINGLMRSSK